MGENGGKFEGDRVPAPLDAATLGSKLQTRFRRQLVELFELGNTYPQIIGQLELKTEYSVDLDTLKLAVQYALRGYDEREGAHKPYKGLMTQEQFEAAEPTIKLPPKRSKTPEGFDQVYWTPAEEQFLKLNWFDDTYKSAGGNVKGKHVWQMIADDLNTRFHEGKKIRTAGAVQKKLQKTLRGNKEN